MTRTDTLELAVWNAESIPEGALTVTRFKLSPDAHDTLAQWSRERTKRHRDEPVTVILRGLSEIMAWFVPEVAFVRHESDPAVRRKRLCLYFVGDVTQSQDLRRRIQAALGLWLGVLYPDKPGDVRNAIAAAAFVEESWSLLDVGSALKTHSGACPVPEDPMLWDALAARAVAELAGETLRFHSGESRRLVAQTAQSSAYEGLELVAFPPKRAPNSDGLWSEVLAVHTPTYPERPTLHVLVRPSIRNWGPVTRWAIGERSKPFPRCLSSYSREWCSHDLQAHLVQIQAHTGQERSSGSKRTTALGCPVAPQARLSSLLPHPTADRGSRNRSV